MIRGVCIGYLIWTVLFTVQGFAATSLPFNCDLILETAAQTEIFEPVKPIDDNQPTTSISTPRTRKVTERYSFHFETIRKHYGDKLSTGADAIEFIRAGQENAIFRVTLRSGKRIAVKAARVYDSRVNEANKMELEMALKVRQVDYEGSEFLSLPIDSFTAKAERQSERDFTHEVVFLEMELADMSLADYLGKLGPKVMLEEPKKIYDLWYKMARGLQAYHRAHLVHRDIKPSNILLKLNERGEVERLWISDFGIRSKMNKPVEHVEPDTVLGTRGYMGWIQAKGGISNQKTDIHLWAVTAMDMIAGYHLTNLRTDLIKDHIRYRTHNSGAGGTVEKNSIEIPVITSTPSEIYLLDGNKKGRKGNVEPGKTDANGRYVFTTPEPMRNILDKALAGEYENFGQVMADIKRAEEGKSVSPPTSRK